MLSTSPMTFSGLPPEIRIIVWQQCLARPRLVVFDGCDVKILCSGPEHERGVNPLSIQQVNCEARDVAFNYFSFTLMYPAARFMVNGARQITLRLNLATDTVYLTASTPLDPLAFIQKTPIQHLAMDNQHFHFIFRHIFTDNLFTQPRAGEEVIARMRSLRTFSFIYRKGISLHGVSYKEWKYMDLASLLALWDGCFLGSSEYIAAETTDSDLLNKLSRFKTSRRREIDEGSDKLRLLVWK